MGACAIRLSEYLISEPAALATFALLATPFCLVGHSHYPIVWTENEDGADVALLNSTEPLMLNPQQRVIVNPGSVGQPRDGDWRASYLIYNSETGDAGTLEHRRVEYDIAAGAAQDPGGGPAGVAGGPAGARALTRTGAP